MKYHCHIYFDQTNKTQVLIGFEQLSNQAFKSLRFKQILDHPFGPHPLPMIELHFEEIDKIHIVDFLKRKSEFNSVLIHEVTDSDQKDHSVGALWVGEKQAIDFSFFKT